jgi:hypothetical protein
MTRLPAEAQLDISILIATRNRAGLLQKSLHTIAQLDTNGISWEIIVVDNGSNDHTAEVLAEEKTLLPLVALHESKLGKNAALNHALAVAQGALYVFTDDDVIPDRNWLKSLLAAADRWRNDFIFGGQIVPLFPNDTPEWMQRADFPFASLAFAKYAPLETEGYVKIAPYGGNFAIRAEEMRGYRYCENIGPSGGNYVMGSETELLKRMAKAGARFVYVPSARVQHVIQSHETTLKSFMMRAYRAGRSFAKSSPHYGCPYLYGAPRYLWRQMFEYWLKHLINYNGSGQSRFENGYSLSFVRGMIYQYRVMATEKNETRQDADGLRDNAITSETEQ